MIIILLQARGNLQLKNYPQAKQDGCLCIIIAAVFTLTRALLIIKGILYILLEYAEMDLKAAFKSLRCVNPMGLIRSFWNQMLEIVKVLLSFCGVLC